MFIRIKTILLISFFTFINAFSLPIFADKYDGTLFPVDLEGLEFARDNCESINRGSRFAEVHDIDDNKVYIYYSMNQYSVKNIDKIQALRNTNMDIIDFSGEGWTPYRALWILMQTNKNDKILREVSTSDGKYSDYLYCR